MQISSHQLHYLRLRSTVQIENIVLRSVAIASLLLPRTCVILAYTSPVIRRIGVDASWTVCTLATSELSRLYGVGCSFCGTDLGFITTGLKCNFMKCLTMGFILEMFVCYTILSAVTVVQWLMSGSHFKTTAVWGVGFSPRVRLKFVTKFFC